MALRRAFLPRPNNLTKHYPLLKIISYFPSLVNLPLSSLSDYGVDGMIENLTKILPLTDLIHLINSARVRTPKYQISEVVLSHSFFFFSPPFQFKISVFSYHFQIFLSNTDIYRVKKITQIIQ